MFRRSKLVVFIALLTCTACVADSTEVPDELPIELKLRETLFKFAEDESISSYDLSSMLGDWAIDGPLFRKAGVGTLGHPLYVVLDAANNKVILGDDREWEGKPFDQAEVVLVSKKREIVNESSFDYDDGIIIFFAPDEVRFIDFSTNTGGRYSRLRGDE